MAKEICISSTPHETRLAILEDDQLAEIYYERENEYTLAGSIYKGRVTRVLPGMQSAFVDIGLERDAFLYVTDFLEEQEDGEEFESVSLPPSTPQRREGREGRRENREPREAREHKAPKETIEVQPTETETTVSPEEGREEEFAPEGTRRWRGRRGRRRGTRGQAREAAAEQPSVVEETPEEVVLEAEAEAETVAAAAEEPLYPETGHTGSASLAAPPIVTLPGEYLAKYGGKPPVVSLEITELPDEPVAKPLPAVTSRPSTLIEEPIEWDGVGLLPGESRSGHSHAAPAIEETEIATPPVSSIAEPEGIFADAPQVDVPQVEENTEQSASTDEKESVETVESAPEIAASPEVEAETASAEEKPAEEHPDKASYKYDPSAPSEFRLFGRKKEPAPAPEPEPQPKTAKETATAETEAHSEESAAHSNYTFAPGQGVVEEEILDEPEAELLPIHAQSEEHEFDELEEETLDHTSDLGEMFQEAHLDHRIQLSFGNAPDTEALSAELDDDVDVESEDEPAAEEQNGQAAAGEQEPRHRRDGRRGRERNGRGRRGAPRRQSAQVTDLPIISDLLKPGQEILVQIAKEPIAKKGARITSHIALPGRFLVFMPTVNHVGVSRKIDSDEERHRLKRILISEKGESTGGFIVRTAAEGATEEELRADLRFLINLWNEIKQRSEEAKAPALIYHDLNLVERILRDQVTDNFSTIWVDGEADYERIVRFLNRFQPSLVRRVKLYTKEMPLFEQFGIQDEITKALKSKVWLKSGGSIVINQTEALVAIDINTGKYVGKTARLEDTIVKTNLDAIPEIVRQIRLRDLGGIIVIDFIDMDERKNRHKVLQALEEELKLDRAPSKVLQFNDFGLVAITRKRVKQSLERTLSVQCPICSGTGMVKSPATLCNEIYIEMRKMQKQFDRGDVLLRVNPDVVKTLKANNARWLGEMEEMIGRNIIVKSDATLHPEQFDIH